MPGRIKGIVGIVVAVVFLGFVAYVFFGQTPGAADTSIGQVANGASPMCCKSDPAAQIRMTLDPKLFTGKVRKAYQVAQNDPALLAQLHCYCGCDRTEGHKSLLDCFRDRHGATCEICTGEAIDAEQLAREGMPVEQIRDTLRTRFASEN